MAAAFVAAQGGDGVVYRVAALPGLVAHRGQDEHGRLAQLAGEVLEQPERRGARPLQVFEQEHHGDALGTGEQRAGGSLVEEEALLLHGLVDVGRGHARGDAGRVGVEGG